MKQKRRRARRHDRLDKQTPRPPSPPAKASEYLHHLDELVADGAATAVVLRCRVSGPAQRPQLDDQAADMRRRVEDEIGIPVVEVCAEVAPGWDLDKQPELDAAIQAAIAHGPGTVVVAESTDRYLRHPDYNGNKKSTPTVAAFEALLDRAQGVPLATLLPPDAPYEDVRYYQQKRGQVAKGNPGGRPPNSKTEPGYKKRRKMVMLSKVFWFTFVAGVSVEKTGLTLKEYPNQIQRWRDKLRGR